MTQDHASPTPHDDPQPTRAKPGRWSLTYDVIMILSIVVNLLFLALEYVLGAGFAWVRECMQLLHVSAPQQTALQHNIGHANTFFTLFLIIELLVRWAIAIAQRQYYRWFFFPFVHWYEVLGCFAILRPLRLLRAVVIAYRLYLLGYPILPRSWIKMGKFYYELILEELSDRIVVHVLDSVTAELNNNQTHYVLVEKIIERHRPQLTRAIIEVLEASVPSAIKAHQQQISSYVGGAVERSVKNTPELQQILHLLPVVGGMLSQRLAAIGASLGENLTHELIDPLTQLPNPLYHEVAQHIGQLHFPAPALEALIDSVTLEALQVIREQVLIQQWKIVADNHAAIKPEQA
jgi:hypothetical protein